MSRILAADRGRGPAGCIGVMVLCEFDPAMVGRISGVRAAHQSYFAELADSVTFGGVLGEDPSAPSGLCYVVEVGDVQEAAQIAAEDPYAPLYADVRVWRFHRRHAEAPSPTGGRDDG